MGVAATKSADTGTMGTPAGLSAATRTSGLINPGQRPAAVVHFEETVVGFFLDAAEILGVPKSVAAIYGLCFASAEPLSFADINDRLDISQGSISQGLRVLREMGALRVVPVEATETGVASPETRRREFFTPDLELRKLASRWIEQRLEKQLQAGKGRLQAMKEAVPADASARERKARLKYLESWHRQSRALVPVIKTFLKLT